MAVTAMLLQVCVLVNPHRAADNKGPGRCDVAHHLEHHGGVHTTRTHAALSASCARAFAESVFAIHHAAIGIMQLQEGFGLPPLPLHHAKLPALHIGRLVQVHLVTTNSIFTITQALVIFKYSLIVLRADDHGQGAALLPLLTRERARPRLLQWRL